MNLNKQSSKGGSARCSYGFGQKGSKYFRVQNKKTGDLDLDSLFSFLTLVCQLFCETTDEKVVVSGDFFLGEAESKIKMSDNKADNSFCLSELSSRSN